MLKKLIKVSSCRLISNTHSRTQDTIGFCCLKLQILMFWVDLFWFLKRATLLFCVKLNWVWQWLWPLQQPSLTNFRYCAGPISLACTCTTLLTTSELATSFVDRHVRTEILHFLQQLPKYDSFVFNELRSSLYRFWCAAVYSWYLWSSLFVSCCACSNSSTSLAC